jgi:hypothetical protein
MGSPVRKPSEQRLRLRNLERPSDGYKYGGQFN